MLSARVHRKPTNFMYSRVSRVECVDPIAFFSPIGCQPRTARKFFDEYQYRILFATDAASHGDNFPRQVFNDKLYESNFRFLETEDEYFDYAPATIPPLGQWRIHGLGLPKRS